MRVFTERFPIRSLLAAIIGFLLGLLSNVLSAYLSDPNLLTAVLMLFFLLVLIYVVWTLRTTHTVYVRFGHPTTLRQGDQALYAREGLVVFVSKHRIVHKKGGPPLPEPQPPAEVKKVDYVAAAKKLDYAALDLENSNLETAIHAIRTHRDKLKHCWLIGTAGNEEQSGSAVYIPALKEYLRRELGMDCLFHDGPAYTLPMDDDEQTYKKTFDLLQRVFREAESYNLPADSMVVDFTGGFRTLSLGAILASLDGKRDIEYVGAHYDASGEIKPHDLFTMIFNFEAVVPRT